MSFITGDIRKLLQIKFKSRQDSVTDQYNRIFMVKMMLIFGMLTGINWFKDDITCIVPKNSEIDTKFVNQACWIQGLYVFKGINGTGRAAYHGVPMEISNDGIFPGKDQTLCPLIDRSNKPTKNCQPMTKTFYLQYQWFPFFVAMLGVMFYIPYVLFHFVNTDMQSLKVSIQSMNADTIVATYFNYQVNIHVRMKLRILANLLVKIGYLLANVAAFLITNALMNDDFRTYGQAWSGWSKNSNQVAYAYSINRKYSKPADILLPTFGLCEVVEANQDVLRTKINMHTFVCEISMHVLYQYVLIVMWFLLVIGMIISCIGFILKLVGHLVTVTCFLSQGSSAKKVYTHISMREIEYLEYLRKKNLGLYRDVIQKLKRDRHLDRQPENYPMHPPRQGDYNPSDDKKPLHGY